MNEAFSARLSALRKERGLSQKEAAEALGISGALLSHYEKGIRECGLQFICKAAAFYDVSCDYLLGVSNTRRAFNEQFDERDTAQDREFRTGTLFRAATMLSDALAVTNPAAADLLRSYFALAVYRVALQARDEGVLPAASCPGIRYQLTVRHRSYSGDGAYHLAMTYLEAEKGKDVTFESIGKRLTQRGTTEDEDATVWQLVGDDGKPEANFLYDPMNQTLTMLTKDFKRIESKLNYTIKRTNKKQ